MGFPYGPTGNLAAVGASAGSMPVVSGFGQPLLDEHGNPLTDQEGNVLTDTAMAPVGLPHNDSQLLVKLNISGSKPS